MSRYWGQNIIIDGSVIREEFDDPLPTMGASNVVIRDKPNATEAAAYEFATQEVFRQIERTTVGKSLIRQVNSSPHTVTVRALNPRASLDKTRTTWEPDTFAGQAAASRGGGGTNVTTWYEPTAWSTPSVKRSMDPANHFQPDDVLFHEMVHALRMLRGLLDLSRIRGWDNIEDLFAIMLTNIYNSSNNRNNDLRGDHAATFHVLGTSALRPTEQIDEQRFYVEFSPDIDRLWRSLPTLCDAISQVPCKWNPLRARVALMKSKIFPPP